MSIKEIFCQDRAISKLKSALVIDRMAHAYIFAGPDGVGKFKTASEWAKLLVCTDEISKGPEPDSCGKCRSFIQFEGDGHPDFHHIYKELKKFTSRGKEKDMPLDLPKIVIDEFLIDKIAVAPVMGGHVVYVISEAEKLNRSSQNTLLKVLEEPPANCVIILLCSRVDKLLPTTLSRCQVLQFGPIDEQIIVEKLIETGVAKGEATYWARFSEGSIGTAMAWARLEPKEMSCYAIKTELLGRICKYTPGESLDLSEWVVAAGKQISTAWSEIETSTSKKDITRRGQKGLLQMITGVFTDVMRSALDAGAILINGDQAELIEGLGQRFGPENAAQQVEIIAEKARWVDASVNEKLIFDELLLNLSGCGILSGSE
jgi:DNA polymerase-3 subunit delta'